MTRSKWIVLASLGLIGAGGVGLDGKSAFALDRNTRAVIELFTSQGCSSCPPADALMQKMAKDPTLVILSFPVDYWDYLGWKDTFSKHDYSVRQHDYANVRGDNEVYTPQAVIDGRTHEVGSDAEGINRSITSLSDSGALSVRVSVEMAGDVVTAHIGSAVRSNEAKATVWLVKYGHEQTVAIGRGENSGHTVTYTNVVTDMQPVGMWKGQAMTLELPRNSMTNSRNSGYALLLQTDVNGRPGPILGATVLDDGKAY